VAKLSSIKVRREAVKVDETQSFDVRGISTNDVMALVAEHGAQLTLMFAKLTSGRDAGSLNPDDVRDIILQLAKEFPDIAAAVIALAAEEYNEDGMALARDLPVLAQMEAIETIFHLTFYSESQVKKLLGSLTKMIGEVSGALKTNVVPGLQTGTGA
jgi:dihydropteroate synthase